MAQVLDYSAGRPGAAAIARDGYVGAVRYIGFPNRRKCTDRAELEDFSRHGLGMALVYEDNADDWRGGFTRGREAALRARNHANAIGFPSGRPIYMAVDRDVVTEAEFRAAVEYIRGAAAVLGGPELTGPYGEHDVCARVDAAGVGQWFWQCRAWSGTPIRYFPRRHLFQRVGYVYPGGIQCDVNDIAESVADWGQHNAQAAKEEDDMPDLYLRNMAERTSHKLGAALRLEEHVEATLTDMGTGDKDMILDEDLPLVTRFLALEADVAALKARPAADVDEAVLAAELQARGIDGVTAAELKEILASIRLVPAESGGGS